MQAITNAATAAVNTAAATGTAVLDAVGLGHAAHAEERTGKQLPVDATASAVKTMDSEGLAVFEDEGVRHAVLVKINQLAIDDKRHGLKELAALELVTDTGKRGIDFYHPKRYFTVTRPSGVDFIGEIEIEAGKSIHVRCHTTHAKATFHSLDTRPGQDGGAVFVTGEALEWFEY